MSDFANSLLTNGNTYGENYRILYYARDVMCMFMLRVIRILIVVAVLSENYSLNEGILHSRFHETEAIRDPS